MMFVLIVVLFYNISSVFASADKAWLNDLGNLSPEDSAAEIAGYVKDTASAKEVAAALRKISNWAEYTAVIMGSDKISAGTAAKIFSEMASEDAAMAMKHSSTACTQSIPGKCYTTQHISADKSAAILSAMDSDISWAIIGNIAASGSYGAQLAGQIVDKINDDKAVELLNNIQGNYKVDAETAKAFILAELEKVNKAKADKYKQKHPKYNAMLIGECADINYVIKNADVIIKGEVIKAEADWEYKSGSRNLFTYVDVRADKYLKGNGEGVIRFKVPGGELNGVSQWVEDMPTFKVGQKGYLCLKKYAENNGDPRLFYRIICGRGMQYNLPGIGQ
jgi:hypothetical protein